MYGKAGRCAKCDLWIHPLEFVYKFTIQNREVIFHMNCFYCVMCKYRFVTGDLVVIQNEKKITCIADYL